MFPESGAPLILGMVIFPREGNMNTCSVMETQGIEGSVSVEIEQHDSIDLIKELDIYSDVKAPYNSQNLDHFLQMIKRIDCGQVCLLWMLCFLLYC